MLAGFAAGPPARGATVAAPAVHRLSRHTAALGGGGSVTIAGRHFRRGSPVLFGRTYSPHVHYVSSDELIAAVPAHAAATVNVRVRVSTRGTRRTSAIVAADRFTYEPKPALTSLTPAAGSTLGGTTVTLKGSGFIALRSVTVGGARVAFHQVSATSLTLRTPPHAAGSVPIVVAGSYGTSASRSFAYRDTTPPAAPSALRADPAAESVTISWHDPADGDLAGISVRRTAGSVPPATPAAGVAVATVAPGVQSVTDRSVAAGQPYAYALFALDRAGNHSVAASITVTTPADSPPPADPPPPVTDPVACHRSSNISWPVNWPACAS